MYSGTAVLLLAAALVAGEPFTGYTLGTYGAILLLALIILLYNFPGIVTILPRLVFT